MREKFPCLIYKNSYIVTVTLVSLFPKTVKYYQVCELMALICFYSIQNLPVLQVVPLLLDGKYSDNNHLRWVTCCPHLEFIKI